MITGIIMASGFSKRMKRDKLTLTINGEPIIERVIMAAKNSKLGEIIIVYQKDEIRHIGLKYKLKTILNLHPEKGQSESMKLGIKSSNLETRGFMFIVGDQPLLNSDTINILIEAFNQNDKGIIVPIYNKKKGSPTIFSSSLKDQLLKVEGDKGGRKIIEERPEIVKFIHIEDYIVGLDIDTWEEYEQINRMGMKI